MANNEYLISSTAAISCTIYDASSGCMVEGLLQVIGTTFTSVTWAGDAAAAAPTAITDTLATACNVTLQVSFLTDGNDTYINYDHTYKIFDDALAHVGSVNSSGAPHFYTIPFEIIPTSTGIEKVALNHICARINESKNINAFLIFTNTNKTHGGTHPEVH